MSRSADILMLESDWGEDLVDSTSARPFVDGFANALGMTMVYRTFHTGRDLGHWLREAFRAKAKPRVVYISSHGDERYLQPSLGTTRIDLRKVLRAATAGSRRSVSRRPGLVLDCCDIGRDLPGILAAAHGRFAWAMGYRGEVPWIESVITSLGFMNYILSGREVPISVGKRGARVRTRSTRTCSAEKAARWVLDDFGIAKTMGFWAVNAR